MLLCSALKLNAQGLSTVCEIDWKNKSFDQVIEGFQSLTGLNFQYDASIVPANRRFNLHYRQVSARFALNDFLLSIGLSYKLTGNSVIVQKIILKPEPQLYKITGRITSASSGEYLIGAMVFNLDNKPAAIASEGGFFNLLLPKGLHTITVSHPGFIPYTDTLLIDRNFILSYELLPKPDTTDEIHITALKGRGLHSVQFGQTEHHQIDAIKMRWLPQLLGETDIVRTMGLMPGVVAGSEGMLGLYVRGGAADQNLVLLDDVPVFNSFHLYGIFSVFNDEVIKNATLMKGSLPGRFGGRLSSVIGVYSKDGNNRHIRGSLNIGLLSTKLFMEGPLGNENTTFLFSFRRSYLDFLASSASRLILRDDSFNGNNLYYFWDLNFRITHRFNQRSRLSLGTYSGRDVGGLSESNETDNSEIFSREKRKQLTGWGNTALGIRWIYQSKKGTEYITRAHFTRYDYNYTQEYSLRREYSGFPSKDVDDFTRYRLNNGIQDIEAGFLMRLYFRKTSRLETGVSTAVHRFIPGNRSFYSRISGTETELFYNDDRINVPELNAYAEFHSNLNPRLFLTLTARASAFLLDKNTRYFLPEPRLNLKYRLTKSDFINLSANRNRQFFHLLNNLSLGLPSDLWVPSTARFKPGQADQFALGYSHAEKMWASSGSLFFKSFRHLLEYKNDAGYVTTGRNWEDAVTAGNGEAYGIELLSEKSSGKLRGWIAYTLMWNNRWFNELNNGRAFPSRYDRRHNLYITTNYTIRKGIDLSMAFTYASGFAYTLPVGYYYSQAPGDAYREIFIYGDRNNARSADNHRLDIALNLEKNKKYFSRIWTLGVFNVYNRFNPFYVTMAYNQKGERKLMQVSMLPLMPNVSYKLILR